MRIKNLTLTNKLMYNANTTLTKMLKLNELYYTSTDFAITPIGRAKKDTPVNRGNLEKEQPQITKMIEAS